MHTEDITITVLYLPQNWEMPLIHDQYGTTQAQDILAINLLKEWLSCQGLQKRPIHLREDCVEMEHHDAERFGVKQNNICCSFFFMKVEDE